MDDFQDPFFRGCTRPAMLFGVPLMLMVITTSAFMLAGAWGALLVSGYVLLVLAFVYAFAVGVMRSATRRDDQRVRQLALRLRMRWRMRRCRRRWKAYSYTPCGHRLER
jgi:type IV secretion system protein VirB3